MEKKLREVGVDVWFLLQLDVFIQGKKVDDRLRVRVPRNNSDNFRLWACDFLKG